MDLHVIALAGTFGRISHRSRVSTPMPSASVTVSPDNRSRQRAPPHARIPAASARFARGWDVGKRGLQLTCQPFDHERSFAKGFRPEVTRARSTLRSNTHVHHRSGTRSPVEAMTTDPSVRRSFHLRCTPSAWLPWCTSTTSVQQRCRPYLRQVVSGLLPLHPDARAAQPVWSAV